MATFEYTRPAKCKDCKFLKAIRNGNKKTHICDNVKSNLYCDKRTLNDYVCEVWEI